MIKNSFKRMKTVDINEDHPSSNFVDWRYTITKDCAK